MIAGRNYTEEVVKVMKTLAIRLEEELHTQLTMLAQLEELSLQDAIKASLVSYIETRAQAPELSAKAEAVLADVEREANARRAAIATLFAAGEPANAGSARNSRGRAKDAAEPPAQQ